MGTEFANDKQTNTNNEILVDLFIVLHQGLLGGEVKALGEVGWNHGILNLVLLTRRREGFEGSTSSEVQKLDVVLPGVQFCELLYRRQLTQTRGELAYSIKKQRCSIG